MGEKDEQPMEVTRLPLTEATAGVIRPAFVELLERQNQLVAAACKLDGIDPEKAAGIVVVDGRLALVMK
ncbi:MAG: hypothetical protein KKD77_21755 [Gammaproteobacteria bacterium]|uniref:Uncharacterized protein n=1 Tax=viral metagenome TaxID=1070528 RepID=A0A6M3LDC3_9ZZZZ|nr:hypothetical protein [Gammaproteobacteria bacterium]